MESKFKVLPGKTSMVLEPSTNTHVLHSTDIKYREIENGIFHIKTGKNAVITHGQFVEGQVAKGNHNTVVVNSASRNMLKLVQLEYNPVTKEMQNAFD